ncbi:amino acid ABC transporter substrate-binding protein [Caldimonas sp. KR1-144]|uniref:amino acid ABC transporter substrate-binding protein n=1 Tax=Caldimonas sp. KR1-144 TaxID=3400911 RepID=UPI003BFB051F
MKFLSSSLRAVPPALALLAGVTLAAPSPQAAPALDPTLARIKEQRVIRLGVREVSRPFSYLDEKKQPAGYAVDLCLKAVDAVKAELKLPDIKVEYVVVSGAERIPKLESGDIDLECGSSTNTKARQEKVAFSNTYFVAGARFAVRKDAAFDSLSALEGRTIALSKGTTSEKLFNQMQQSGGFKVNLVQYPNNAEAFKAVREGKAAAFVHDDVLLMGQITAQSADADMTVTGSPLSVEPYGIMARKSDGALLAIVDRTLVGLFQSGEVQKLYDKWFDSKSFKVPMSRLTRDSIARPTKEAGVAMVLGYSL